MIQAGSMGFRHLQQYAGTAYISGQIGMMELGEHTLISRSKSEASEQIGIMEIKIGKRCNIIAVPPPTVHVLMD
jgi:hypothetical protein